MKEHGQWLAESIYTLPRSNPDTYLLSALGDHVRIGETGDHLFVISAICLVMSLFDVSVCHKPLSVMCIAFLS